MTYFCSCTRSRRYIVILTGASLFLLSAGWTKPSSVTLDVVLFNYQSRGIFEVIVGRTDIGVAGPWPRSGRGSMGRVPLRVGPQQVTWRYSDTGDTVVAKNKPELSYIPREIAFLGLHIYDDGSVELIPSQHFPVISKRGERYDAQWKKSKN